MTLSAARTWLYSTNNRLAYTSRVQVMRDFLFALKEFLKANGYTVIGSSNGAAATPTGLITVANDSVDRWITAANAGTRGTVAAAPQSWVVLRDGNGVDILFTYQGAGASPTGDDICRISFSPGNLFTSAATPTHQPTATDEQVMTTATTIITTNTDDRIWHGWVADNAKAFRVMLIRASVVIGVWGVENITSAVVAPSVFNPNAVGFAYDRTGLINIFTSFAASTRGGVARVNVASLPVNVQVGGGLETALGATSLVTSFTPHVELQGGTKYPVWPIGWWTLTAVGRGKLGMRIDWWGGGADDGNTYNNRAFINIAGTLWPWDGVTVPVIF
jgi:hypothetical protein